MKSLTTTLFILLFYCISYSQHPLTYFHTATIDTNNIELRSSNVGNCEGARWWVLPDSGNAYNWIIYDHGPWLVGKINEDSVLSIHQWWHGWSYSPGPIISGEPAMLIHPEDSLKYRVYKISKGDDNTNPDYAEWPDEFGAPLNDEGKPLIYAEQTLWTVYNSYDSTAILNFSYPWYEEINPIPLEIQQLVYAHGGFSNDADDILSNVIFYEWIIINKGEIPIDSSYFGFWSDIDFADAGDDNLPAIDTINQIGYCWAANETYWGEIPAAVGYVLLYGPAVHSPGNTAIFKGREIDNHKNLQLSAFKGIEDDSTWGDSLHSPVVSMTEAQNVARGLTSNGYTIIDPVTNQPTTFPFSGDPVTGQGWLWTHPISGGAGLVYFSGPFTLAPNDTQWVMMAVIPGFGSSNLNSITQMRRKAEILRSLPYDSLAFGTLSYPITDVEDEGQITTPKEFSLYQNYPNPFNPITTIKYQIPELSFVTLKVYDVLGNKIATLVNKELPAGVYEVEFNPASSIRYPASGIYFYQLQAGNFVETKKMILIK
jgi:hypothetical protein